MQSDGAVACKSVARKWRTTDTQFCQDSLKTDSPNSFSAAAAGVSVVDIPFEVGDVLIVRLTADFDDFRKKLVSVV